MSGQAPAIPPALQALMADVGPRWGSSVQQHVRQMVEAFSAVLVNAPKAGTVEADIAYGPHPRQVLDIYRPTQLSPAGAMPVLMFVHGGAFVDGDKNRSSEVYANVLWYFARHGILGINVEFRLAPESTFPGGTEDIASAVAWVRAHAGRLGGDPHRIFLMGHSAGAAHAAHYAYDSDFHPQGGPGLAGLVVVSGRVRAETWPGNPNASRVQAYYQTKEAMQRGSAVHHVRSDSVPTMLAVAEYENPLIDMHCAELAYRIAQAKRQAPRFVWLPRHNHTSIVAHLNTAEDVLGRHIREFIATGR